jgi:hypothetical protein
VHVFFDAGQFVVSIVKAFKDAKRMQAWGQLAFGMLFSGLVAHYGVTGFSLIAGATGAVAEGRADIAVAVSLLAFCA